MRGQVEMLTSVLESEHREVHRDPAAAQAALRDTMVEDGMTPRTAAAAAAEVSRDPEKALAVYVRHKLGINPEELGSARGSAISSFIMFSVGALVPLLPWFFWGGAAAIVTSLLLSVLSALVIGGYLGYTTNGRWLRSALRQLIVLVFAAAATFLIGRLFHTTIT
jgi:vacuolar iron transporter family protein